MATSRLSIGSDLDDNENGGSAGSAHIFRHDGLGWVEDQRLIAGDGSPQDNFGDSVTIGSNTALIGAEFASDSGVSAGGAYVFDLSLALSVPSLGPVGIALFGIVIGVAGIGYLRVR